MPTRMTDRNGMRGGAGISAVVLAGRNYAPEVPDAPILRSHGLDGHAESARGLASGK